MKDTERRWDNKASKTRPEEGEMMIQERVDNSKARAVALAGDLSIERSRELRDLLLAELKQGGEVVLELGESSGADLSFFQLLCSAHRTAARLGVSLELGSGTVKKLLDAADEAGYLRDKCCPYSTDATCLWLRRGRE